MTVDRICVLCQEPVEIFDRTAGRWHPLNKGYCFKTRLSSKYRFVHHECGQLLLLALAGYEDVEIVTKE